jgi:threonyl-tRNA synthetase
LENGFYYDAYFGKDKKITEEDLEKIDKRIKEIVAQKQPFERLKLTVVLDYYEALETYSRIGLLRSYSRIGLLRSYENLQSYWTTTKLQSYWTTTKL